MSIVRKDKEVKKAYGVFCSDLHLSLNPPLIRSHRPDWFAAMAKSLKVLKDLAEEHQCPVFCSGDVFDHWRSPPELINFALDNLPDMYAIPGQHDLPYHVYEDIDKSAFGTLVKAGKIKLVPEVGQLISTSAGDVFVAGFPWKRDVRESPTMKLLPKDTMKIAITHQYIWSGDSKFRHADITNNVTSKTASFKTFDCVFVGDNHKPFQEHLHTGDGSRTFRTLVVNCGGFMVRKSDDIHNPMAYVLTDDGSTIFEAATDDRPRARHFVDSGEEQQHDTAMELINFIKVQLGEKGNADYAAVVRQSLHNKKATKAVRKLVMEALDNGKSR